MTVLEAIEARHAVRSYTDQQLPADAVSRLKAEIDACNREGGLHIQLVTDEPRAFDGMLAHYGKLRASGLRRAASPESAGLEERVGITANVALCADDGAQQLWVAMSFSKGAAKKRCAAAAGEKLVCVLALGYGATQGVPHRSKPMDALCKTDVPMPDWFRAGMEAAMLAPTAVNQQKFLITLSGGRAAAKSLGGFYSMVDLGIVRYHFEAASGKPLA